MDALAMPEKKVSNETVESENYLEVKNYQKLPRSWKKLSIFQINHVGHGTQTIWFFSVLVPKINLLVYKFIILSQIIDWG